MDVESAITSSLARLGSGVYNDPPRIIRDATRLLRSPLGIHLRPTTSPLVYEDGTSTPPVLVLSGTIGMSYKGTTYNIPVDIYLPPPYPMKPPVIFVRPTPGMMIKPNHPHVGSDGKVYMPYLSEWRALQGSNLVEMAVHLSSLFGAVPPVYAKPATAGTTSNTSAGGSTESGRERKRDQIAAAATTMASNFMAGVFNPNQPQQEQTGGGATPPSYDSLGNTPPSSGNTNSGRENSTDTTDDPDIRRAVEASRIEAELSAAKRREEEAQRKAEDEQRMQEAQRLSEQAEEERQKRVEEETHVKVKDELTRKLQGCLSTLYTDSRQVISEDLRSQTKLERSSEDLAQELCDLRSRKEELNTAHIQLDQSLTNIQSFLSTLEGRVEIPVDDMCQPATVHSRQMLELSAQSHTISDVLYFLDRGLVRGTIGLDVHLKTVRRLAKKQFMAKALLMKVQQQAE